MITKMLRYGCVGAGAVARAKHMKGYSSLNGIEFVSVCDTNEKFAKEAASEFGFKKYYTDYREMLEKEQLDFISVCVPNYLHFPVTLMALEKGMHVHCEKPIALNSIEAQKMVDAKNKYGKILMVALNNRFTNHAWFVKKYAEEGLFGEIYHARCGWKPNKALSGGGPLIDLGVHFMDLVLYFMGFPKPVSVTGAAYSKFSQNNCVNSSGWGMTSDKNGIMDVEDMAVGFVRLENDATVDIEFSWASNIEQDESFYELRGTKGGAIYRRGELKIVTEQISTVVDVKPNLNFNCPINEFSHFIDCIKTGKEPLSKPEEAVILMRIIDGIYKSSQAKQEIKL